MIRIAILILAIFLIFPFLHSCGCPDDEQSLKIIGIDNKIKIVGDSNNPTFKSYRFELNQKVESVAKSKDSLNIYYANVGPFGCFVKTEFTILNPIDSFFALTNKNYNDSVGKNITNICLDLNGDPFFTSARINTFDFTKKLVLKNAPKFKDTFQITFKMKDIHGELFETTTRKFIISPN